MFAAITAVLTCIAQPARAQGAPKFELGVGYQYMHDNESSLNFTKGWVVSVGADVASWFAVVGEFGGSYKTLASVGNASVALNQYTFVGGPRITASSKAPVAPFVQVLFGGVTGALDISAANSNLTVSETHFLIQPGAGIDFNPSPQFGIRFEADGRSIQRDPDNRSQWRLIGALVFRL